MRPSGVKLSINNFGTGYSSFTTYTRLHSDTIKLDKSFVRSIAPNQLAHRLVQAMIRVRRDSHSGFVAEGSEPRA